MREKILVPLLKEYVKISKKYDKICVLEIKNHFKEHDLKRLIEEIREMDYIDNVIFISFDFENCVNVRKMLPESPVQWLAYGQDVTEKSIQKLIENKLDLDIYYKDLNAETIELLHSKGIKVNCWTCDDKYDAEKLVSWGVDFITTNILE